MLNFEQFFKKTPVVEANETENIAVDAEVEGHLTHLEDLAIEKGKAGFEMAVEQITGFYNHINNLSNNTKINLKVDGSPSLFWGFDPRPSWKNKFFIATKSIFAAKEPKLVHDAQEIDRYYADADQELKNILKFVLPYLKSGYDNSGFIYNGDLLYTPARPVEKKIISGEMFLTFKPNTIEYAVPVNEQSELYNRIKNSNIGIIVHYKTKAQVEKIKVRNTKTNLVSDREIFNLPLTGQDATSIVNSLNKVPGVFAEGSHLQPLNIKIDLGVKELYQKYYHGAVEGMKNITTEFNELYLSKSKVVELLKKYLNHTVRNDSNLFKLQVADVVFNPEEYINGFKSFAETEMHKAASNPKLKTRGQANALLRKKDIVNFIETNKLSLFNLINVTYNLSQIKLIIHNILIRSALPALKDLKTFTYKNGAYVDMSGEGHVLYIGTSANRVKIVDRIEFSKQNFEVGGKRAIAPTPENLSEVLTPTVYKTVGVCYGRWNPPHKGHKEAWMMAAQCDEFYIGTNDTTQGPDDPLPYNIKVSCMKAIWPEIEGHVYPEKNLLHLAAKVYKDQGESIDLKVYTDETWLTDLLKKYNGKEGVYGVYKFNSIEQVATPRLSSATALRKAVRTNDREAFAQAAGVSANTPIIVDGYEVNFFDIVAHYLSQYTEKVKRTKK